MWPNPQGAVHMVRFTAEILNGKLRFLCSVYSSFKYSWYAEWNKQSQLTEISNVNIM